MFTPGQDALQKLSCSCPFSAVWERAWYPVPQFCEIILLFFKFILANSMGNGNTLLLFNLDLSIGLNGLYIFGPFVFIILFFNLFILVEG